MRLSGCNINSRRRGSDGDLDYLLVGHHAQSAPIQDAGPRVVAEFLERGECMSKKKEKMSDMSDTSGQENQALSSPDVRHVRQNDGRRLAELEGMLKRRKLDEMFMDLGDLMVIREIHDSKLYQQVGTFGQWCKSQGLDRMIIYEKLQNLQVLGERFMRAIEHAGLPMRTFRVLRALPADVRMEIANTGIIRVNELDVQIETASREQLKEAFVGLYAKHAEQKELAKSRAANSLKLKKEKDLLGERVKTLQAELKQLTEEYDDINAALDKDEGAKRVARRVKILQEKVAKLEGERAASEALIAKGEEAMKAIDLVLGKTVSELSKVRQIDLTNWTVGVQVLSSLEALRTQVDHEIDRVNEAVASLADLPGGPPMLPGYEIDWEGAVPHVRFIGKKKDDNGKTDHQVGAEESR